PRGRQSALAPDELVERGDGRAFGDGDVHGVHDPPLDSDAVTGRAEEVLGVLRFVAELVTRVAVHLAVPADWIYDSRPVALDETTQELARFGIHDLLLPASQLDPPRVLVSGTVLREQARPLLGVHRQLGRLLTRMGLPQDRLPG